MSIVSGMMSVLEDQAARHNVAHISKVTVRVGKMKAVEPSTLVACFELFAEGTIAQGAELVVEQVPVRARCGDCGEEFEIGGFRFRCRRCDSAALAIISGEELYVESFEF
jgi:hydrogenase nickel incorporation protein HypA/HybF